MLTTEQITDAVAQVAKRYPVRAVHLFGSYADGTATENSDVDFFVEFEQSPVSFFKVMGMRAALDDILGKDIDIVKACPPCGIEGMVKVYEAERA